MAKKGKKKIGCIIFIVIFIAVIAGLVIFLMKMASKGIAMLSYVPYGEVAVKDLSEYVNVSGNVSSSDSYNVTAEVLQKVTKLNVKVGDSVKKGDLLCELDQTALQEKYDKLAASAGKAQDAESYKSGILRRNLTDAKNNKA
ncbi:MAG: biotin/lipoyl-binding protein, partial [Oscillospiraceae bacterium]|nr:biotin/lipoyl-binding protein [Oscillospiraceae bacterium]